MISVAASEIQKSFGEWHDKALQSPVEITKYGRTSAVLVSATLFQAMWSSFRQTRTAASLSDSEMEMIMGSQIDADTQYNLDDLPDIGGTSDGHKA